MLHIAMIVAFGAGIMHNPVYNPDQTLMTEVPIPTVALSPCGAPSLDQYFYAAAFGRCNPYLNGQSMRLEPPQTCSENPSYTLTVFTDPECKLEKQSGTLTPGVCENALGVSLKVDADACPLAQAVYAVNAGALKMQQYYTEVCTDPRFAGEETEVPAVDRLLPVNPTETCLTGPDFGYKLSFSFGKRAGSLAVCRRETFFPKAEPSCDESRAESTWEDYEQCSTVGNLKGYSRFRSFSGFETADLVKAVCSLNRLAPETYPLGPSGVCSDVEASATVQDICNEVLKENPTKKPSGPDGNGEKPSGPDNSGKEPSGPDSSSVAAFVFMGILIALLLAYCSAGVVYRYKNGGRGVELIPHWGSIRKCFGKKIGLGKPPWSALDTVEAEEDLDIFDDTVLDEIDAEGNNAELHIEE